MCLNIIATIKVVERNVFGAIPAVVMATLLCLCVERNIVLISTTAQDLGLLLLLPWFKLAVRRWYPWRHFAQGYMMQWSTKMFYVPLNILWPLSKRTFAEAECCAWGSDGHGVVTRTWLWSLLVSAIWGNIFARFSGLTWVIIFKSWNYQPSLLLTF